VIQILYAVAFCLCRGKIRARKPRSVSFSKFTSQANLLAAFVLWKGILHCQMTHNITGTREALVAAQKDGLVDFYNQLTSAGRNVGQMMLSNLEDYQTLFDVKFKKPPDFVDQQATH
jgi:hypothetical protein